MILTCSGLRSGLTYNGKRDYTSALGGSQMQWERFWSHSDQLWFILLPQNSYPAAQAQGQVNSLYVHRNHFSQFSYERIPAETQNKAQSNSFFC